MMEKPGHPASARPGPSRPRDGRATLQRVHRAGPWRPPAASALVVGLSGGIDSAVAAGLAVRAASGPASVLGVMLPYRTSVAGLA